MSVKSLDEFVYSEAVIYQRPRRHLINYDILYSNHRLKRPTMKFRLSLRALSYC